jgi:cytochrome c-type biogenesis protein CcmF
VTLSDVSIATNLLRDVYVVMGEPMDGGAREVRVQINPLVPWIWLGGVVMAIGGVTAVWPRRVMKEAAPEAEPPV